MKGKILRGNLYFGALLFLSATFLLTANNSFMKTWYYIFAWWSFILILDSVNFRSTGNSPLSEGVSKFLFMGFISVCAWLIFELFNLRLRNWSYFYLPRRIFPRWLGYILAFATVIPALKELSVFFQKYFRDKPIKLFRVRPTGYLCFGSFVFGVLCIGGALIWPRLCFPLVWLGLYFLIEPLNYRLKEVTLLAEIEKNEWGKFWSWIFSGLTAGFLWEFWNFWAGSHWEYSLPYLDFWRVFQMPVFGYLGFLPFALEIFAIWNLALAIQKRIKKSVTLSVAVIFLLLLFCFASFYLMDKISVIP
ncbi:hypothetical protein ACFLRX_00855 [Acidobacteriota bacterium]